MAEDPKQIVVPDMLEKMYRDFTKPEISDEPPPKMVYGVFAWDEARWYPAPYVIDQCKSKQRFTLVENKYQNMAEARKLLGISDER